MFNLKTLFKTIYENDDFNFIEQEEDGSYVFYPEPNVKGYKVNSLNELKPLLIYWRLSSICNTFLILTCLIILIILFHQFFNMDGLFTTMVLTLCLTACLTSAFFLWYLKKFKRVEIKSKTGKKIKFMALAFCILYVILGLSFIYSCPCCIYGNFIDNQEWQKAFNTINFFIKLQPKNDNLYENRALIKYNLNDIDGAIEDSNKALELNPENEWSLSEKAYYTFAKEKILTSEIVDMFEKAITLNETEYPIAYSNRGKIYYLLGESDKAIKDFEQAYMRTGNEFFNYLSALAYEQKGDYCKAFAYYNTVPQNKHFKITELQAKKEYAKFMCKE